MVVQISHDLSPQISERDAIRVLIIDDDEDDFELIRCALEDVKDFVYEVTWTDTAKRAIAYLKTTPVEICLCDYRIGGATGIDLINQIRENGCESPIVLVTGTNQRDIDIAAADVGAADYLEKDQITPDRLERIIRYALAQHERQKLKREKEGAEEFSKLKSAFLAMISHELRTPLNAISGFTELMLAENQGNPDLQRNFRYLNEIKTSTERLQNLIESILDFSELAAGRLETHNDVVIPSLELNRCLSELKKAAEDKSIEFDISIECPTVCLIGDPRAIRKIFSNLISNAIKFSPPSCRIGVSCNISETGNLIFKVSDPGIGMSRSAIAQVYEPFRQVDQSLSRAFEGIGLGLPLVRALASLHEADVEIDSLPQIGTDVSVVFPACRIENGDKQTQTSA